MKMKFIVQSLSFGSLFVMVFLFCSDFALARGGGGGSGGGGGGGGFGSSSGSGSVDPKSGLIFTGLMTLIFAIVIFVVWYVRKKRVQQAAQVMQQASFSDTAWETGSLQAYIEAVFYRFQADWMNFDLASMQTYVTATYFEHIRLMLTALRNMERQNTMDKVFLKRATIMDAHDDADNAKDTVMIEIEATAKDKLVDMRTNKTLYTDPTSSWGFSEAWAFRRENGNWKLNAINQLFASEDGVFKGFAEQNGFFYSKDWGWLLLPQRGRLFSQASFVNSDINHHVIGMYHNALIEFYSYTPSSKSSNKYTLAQAILPKSYDNIIVRTSKDFSLKGWWYEKNLQHVSTEWNAFQKKYEVLTSNAEGAVAFELLHPGFMEKLEALPFELNIEVVDAVLYLYTNDKQADYATMLGILKDAFDEMKM
jgi:hypothetical protein